MRNSARILACLLTAIAASLAIGSRSVRAQPAFDIVIENGRVMDPESGLDGIRNIGIRGDRIAAISADVLVGRLMLDVRGLVVAPGFIDLHQHGQNAQNVRKARMVDYWRVRGWPDLCRPMGTDDFVCD